MKKEEKEILYQDLSSRLPYDVRVKYESITGKSLNKEGILDEINRRNVSISGQRGYSLGLVKPYLRRMTSMTTTEKETYAKLLFPNLGGLYEDYYKALDYLHSRHLDYRGLIDKGLALEAPTGMYKL
jgi:hypothetical protein